MEYIVIRFISLVVALFCMQFYACSDAYSKSHRLLPVLLTGVCIYDFYEMVLAFTGATHVFTILEQLLFVQMIYVFLHYMFDFSHAKIPIYLECIGFISLIFGDVFILFMNILEYPIFRYLYLIFVYAYSCSIFIISVLFSYSQRIKSKRERYVAGMIYLAFSLTIIGIILRSISNYGIPVLSSCLIATCAIVLYLLKKGYLLDVSTELQDRLFSSNNVATILFDGEQQYLRSNNIAREHFEESYLQNFYHFSEDKELLEYNQHYYKTHIQKISSNGNHYGYVVTLTDLTEEQQMILSLSKEKSSVEELARRKDSILSVLSHKMRSPLNVIIGMCDSLLRKNVSEKSMDDMLHSIKSSGNELLSYVNEMLISSGADASVLTENQLRNSMLSQLQEEHVEPSILFPKAKVLVAEDILVNQEVFKRLAEPWKFQIDFVENGQQAIAAVNKHTYQLIFLDKMMPILNGIDTAHIIKQICDTPLVLVTADNTDNLPSEYLNYGFSGYLAKPLSLASFKRVIETLMPVDYQEFADDDDDIFIPEDNQNAVIALYCDELISLSDKMPELMKDNISLYRTTVHGIKSSSKQLGYLEIGKEAESLEMAAKLENKDYINTNTPAFVDLCHNTAQQIRERM